MISALTIPLRALIFTASGILLAVGWYRWSRLYIVIAVLVILAVLGGIQAYGRMQIRTNPVRALKFLESRAISIAIASALFGAAGTILGIQFAAPDGTAEPDKALITAGVTALTAFISAVAITAETLDKSVGEYVMTQFRTRFENDGVPNTTIFARGSMGEIALYTKYFGGWTDWSASNRAARAKALEGALVP